MNNECVIVVLPLPPKWLSPNVSFATLGGRMAKASASKKYRSLVAKLIDEEQIQTKPWKKVRVTPFFYHKDKRKRDADNAVASLKPAYDGIVDSGLVADDDPGNMERKFPVFSIDKKNPRLMLRIERIK